MIEFPRISFGMIVLNGEPFVRYNLRALYPFAHEIIVVEGAVPGAINVATSDGHSRDVTLDTLHQFKAQEDPDNKLRIITRDGFWSEKDEMSQAYADCATGDYLWQVDSDEFYRTQDMQAILSMLKDDPTITAVSFEMLTFWGSPDYIVDSWYLKRGANVFHRLFKWGDGFQYVTHRPPTVYDNAGRDTRSVNWTTGNQLATKGIFMYHYSLLLPKQVIEKSDYYGKTFAHFSGGLPWATENYMKLRHPFHVHNVYRYPSWLKRFQGYHPEQVVQLWQDLQSGQPQLDLRPTDDIEQLLNTRTYQLQRIFVEWLDYPTRMVIYTKYIFRRILRLMKRMLRAIGDHK